MLDKNPLISLTILAWLTSLTYFISFRPSYNAAALFVVSTQNGTFRMKDIQDERHLYVTGEEISNVSTALTHGSVLNPHIPTYYQEADEKKKKEADAKAKKEADEKKKKKKKEADAKAKKEADEKKKKEADAKAKKEADEKKKKEADAKASAQYPHVDLVFSSHNGDKDESTIRRNDNALAVGAGDVSPINSVRLTPMLSFTSSKAWEEIAPTNGISPDVELKLLENVGGDGSMILRKGRTVSFIISGFHTKENTTIESCGDGLSGAGVFVWFESVNTKVVLSAPALSYHRGESNRGGDLIARVSFHDPGEYRAHVVGYGQTVKEEGAHGTIAVILPVRKSPWHFRVASEGEEQPTGRTGPPAPIQFKLPTRTCEFADLEVSGEGRWVECTAAGISTFECLFNGWVYMPYKCRHSAATTIGVLEQSKAIADKRGGRPVWIVVTGSSIERGTVQAMIDLVSAIGMLEGDRVERSVADALFQDVKNMRGKGSTTKCWGWIDVQVGNIRLSYQDARLTYMGNNPQSEWIEPTRHRWHELLSERPDLVVFGLWSSVKKGYDLAVSQVVQAAAATRHFDGLITFHPTKDRILGGGIATSYTCADDAGNAQSSIDMVRRSIDKALDECIECDHLKVGRRFAVSDEMLMSWSFLFDMERPMSSKLASQHFHKTVSKAMARPVCGSIHSNRRYVIGSVTEMAARMYLGAVLSHLSDQAGLTNNSKSPREDHCNIPQDDKKWEVTLATSHPFRACFTCPVSSIPWKPPLSPNSTLSAPVLANKVENFDDASKHQNKTGGNVEFCYDASD